jgi:hypothetical protein
LFNGLRWNGPENACTYAGGQFWIVAFLDFVCNIGITNECIKSAMCSLQDTLYVEGQQVALSS